jgi:hypothetical protein
LALDLIRSVPYSRHQHPEELVQSLADAIADPVGARDGLRPWLASDWFVNREAAKLIFEWGGSERTGDSLLRQVAFVCLLHINDANFERAIALIGERLGRMHSGPDSGPQ